MNAVIAVSLLRLMDAAKKNELENLRQELAKAEKVVFKAYRLPRPFPFKVRSVDKRLVELNSGIYNRLEYALFKAAIEAARANRLPTFKEIAELASDYKAVAKYLVMLSEQGLVVFPNPEKATKLVEATKAISESRYVRRITKVLDLPVILNVKALEEKAKELDCAFKKDTIICKYHSHDWEREQEKLQVKLFNEYLVSATAGETRS